jgi:hypothetical protein
MSHRLGASASSTAAEPAALERLYGREGWSARRVARALGLLAEALLAWLKALASSGKG